MWRFQVSTEKNTYFLSKFHKIISFSPPIWKNILVQDHTQGLKIIEEKLLSVFLYLNGKNFESSRIKDFKPEVPSQL